MSRLSKDGENLYAACFKSAKQSEAGMAKQFLQHDLEALTKFSASELLTLIHELTSHSLFRSFKSNGSMAWSVRAKELAASIGTLNEVEKIVFSHIEDAGTAGIWIKRIRAIANIEATNVSKAIGKLERSGIVKGIKSVKSPAQRIYILSHLAPSDDVTGGSFFDAGELDQSLVEELCKLIVFRVRSQSWHETKRRIKREASAIEIDSSKRKRDDDEESPRKRRQGDAENGRSKLSNGQVDTHDIEDISLPKRKYDYDSVEVQLAHPVGTREYPTADSVHEWIITSKAIREDKAQSVTVEEIQGLMNVLMWDEKLEKIGNGYRTVRGVRHEEFDAGTPTDEVVNNGLTEVPCSRCPLFDLCTEGTKVSAATCTYYEAWLKTDIPTRS